MVFYIITNASGLITGSGIMMDSFGTVALRVHDEPGEEEGGEYILQGPQTRTFGARGGEPDGVDVAVGARSGLASGLAAYM